jgi:hypothetical protein
MRLNGWQRLGTVAFIIWIFVGSFWAWDEFHYVSGNLYSKDYRLCIEYKKIGTERQACEAQALGSFHASWSKGTNDFWNWLAVVILIPPLIIRALISLIIVVVRWIRRGFAARA